MSYILEALRKADAQRERNRVPGLHAHPLAAEAPVPAQRWGGSVMAALAAIGVVAAIAITWRLATPGAAPAVPVPERVAAAPAVVQEPAPAAPVAATPGPATAIVPAAPPPLPPQPAREQKAPAAAAQAPITVPPASAVPAAAAASAPAPAIANGPPPGLPQLAVSGGVYSQNPAQRMLIVNGGVFNEGSEVARGVRLEEVRADKKAVLNFNGQRFALPY
jgi:general secretion pathway protein B